LGTAVIDLFEDKGDIIPVVSLLDGAWPELATGTIVNSAHSHAGEFHLRNLTRVQYNSAPAGSFGGVECIAVYELPFYLDGKEGEWGPVPPGVFWLELSHDGVLYAENTQGQGWVQSDAQVSINDWTNTWDVYNTIGEDENRDFKQSEIRVDLAGWGLGFGTEYYLIMILSDVANSLDATTVTDALLMTDSTLRANIVVGDLPGDVNDDWTVTLQDIAELAAYWLEVW
jgi:hypothetical protein